MMKSQVATYDVNCDSCFNKILYLMACLNHYINKTKRYYYSLMTMTTIIIAAMQDSILTLESSKTGWKTQESLKGTSPQCIAFDPRNSNRAYCGTFGDGLQKTDDGGQTWDSIGKNSSSISSKDVMSVAVSHHHLKRGNNGFNTVYVGTEPTYLYRSDNGGNSWDRMSALNNLVLNIMELVLGIDTMNYPCNWKTPCPLS